jgi:penicillin-binding protein 1A
VAPAVGCLGSIGILTLVAAVAVLVLGVIAAAGGAWWFSRDLPTVEALRAYKPPTVTIVEDRHGNVLGEIFEERRYVVPIEEIPLHVKQAFLAAEDANFYEHGGVDYAGILRAMGRNARQGRMAQGASTITQQVARNFLLTRDKKLERKIKEILLSWRIEDTYAKDHILFLYLNEIFLGSQAYGVEAASRTYFGKSVRDVTVAEAAILAGLPQRPSETSPLRHWDNARARQEYVLRQMVDKDFLTAEQGQQALDEDVRITPPDNAFREQAPWFTEHVRRTLVEKYGEQRVLHEGLRVRTTCDLELQRVAQEAVTKGVFEVDQRMGYRRDAASRVTAAEIDGVRAEHERKMREAWAAEQDAAGRVALPERSILSPGEVAEAVVLEVSPKWARVGIGLHEGIVPGAWSDWIYEPDPTRSWRTRTARDLTVTVDSDEDGSRDTSILAKGDLIHVKIEALSTRAPEVAKVFADTPGATADKVAVRVWQDPEVEAALLSMDLDTGAVRAMVGGSDFSESEFNRAIQARRQVGSTFKPIVYAAAIESRRVTASSIFADAPLAMATADEFVWKPANYSHDYEGNMTLRQALAKSKNTCTVRILEATDPGMNGDVVYAFARKLGIGGPPTHALPPDWIPTPETDVLCPWVRETDKSTICMDRWPPKLDTLTDRQHRAQLKREDVYWCRACDMSMGLGSASLTMEELIRAYSAFPTGGRLVQPYTIEEVVDRDGNVLERHEPGPPVQVVEPAVASITTWLLEGVARYGTGAQAYQALRLEGLGGKTGTTNDEKDAWFVGFTPEVITAVWVGFDQPRSLGISSTGGRTALPIWIDYMKVAAPQSRDRAFPMRGALTYAMIDEATGRRVVSGGVSYPFLEGTVPEGSGLKAGQVSIEDISTEL